MKLIDLETLDFSKLLHNYVNRTGRFYIPVPELTNGGMLLTIPGSNPPQPIRKKRPEAKGFAFPNAVDSTWQGAIGDATEGIVVNGVTATEAAAIHQLVQQHLDHNVGIESLNRLVEKLIELGFADLYHKGDEDILAAHTRCEIEGDNEDHARPYGYWTVSKPDLHAACLIHEPFFTESGPVVQLYSTGAVVLDYGKHRWCIATEVFLKNFRRVVNGKEMPLSSLDQEFQS